MTADVWVHDDRVTIDLHGLDKVAALAGHVEVPMEHVTGARVVPTAEAKAALGWRVGGTFWPGAVTAGYFTERQRRGARQWWSVYRDAEVLVIDTDLDRPSRVVLQHPDRDRLAWLISERVDR
jgi:hypothetical protein